MEADAIAVISAAVVTLTQLVKWVGLPDKFGALAVLILSAVGAGLWAWSQLPPDIDWRATAWPLFAGWIVIATSAAGVFGFSRAVSATGVTKGSAPPTGAGQHTTVKDL